MTSQMHPDDRAFLPSALAVQRTPPSPLGRTLLWAVVACLGSAVAWACWGQLDIVSVAQGKVIASDRIQVIQSFAHGVIQTIHVRDGDRVKSGQLLITLDPTAATTELDRLRGAFVAADGERRRVIAELAALDRLEAPSGRLQPGEQLPPMPKNQYRRFSASLASLFSTRTVASRDIAALHAELRVVRARLSSIEATLPIVEQRAATLMKLTKNQHIATYQWLEVEEQRLAHQNNLETEKRRVQQLESSIHAQRARNAAQLADWRHARTTELAEMAQRTDQLREERHKASYILQQTQIHAPITGRVQQLAVHTDGGVVTPAQELLRIAPLNRQFEVEARLANRDIGHVRVGHPATVKVDSYPFTRHGSLTGTVSTLSNDAVEDERNGLAYGLRVALQDSTLRGNGEIVEIRPGMAVSVEVTTGKRRVIEYLLTPLVRAARESLRER